MVLVKNQVSQTNFDNLPYLLTYVFILFVIGGLIFKFKESIKQRLSVINGEINTLRSDSQWHTPLALFYTALYLYRVPFGS